ncbi:energy transducer TonB [Verrucomicrobium spinosum]|uniref:energy transducer TonB n=1 Tax=Verrucomicrobium spinosum TaxID=2736 RepID=UPI003CCD3A59
MRLLVVVEMSGIPGSVSVQSSSGNGELDSAAQDHVRRRWRWPAGEIRRYIVPCASCSAELRHPAFLDSFPLPAPHAQPAPRQRPRRSLPPWWPYHVAHWRGHLCRHRHHL